MNTDIIKRIFQSQFDYKTYCNEIVHNIFGCNDIATGPEQLPPSSDGDQNYFIGRMADADKRDLGFFYTRVAEGSDVRRKRVGLRKLIAPYLKYEVDAAIAVFDDGNHWRLSYICDMKEGVTAAKRFSYILGDPQGQYKTPTERLSALGTQAASLRLSDIRDAFSVDALSKEFFDEYHRHYDIIVKELEREGNSGTIYHDYVKKMLGRIVFLHFLQKKGWLDGNQAFLRDLFFMQPLDRRADFLEKVMEPLFFGIFNTEIGQRGRLFSDRHWDKQLLEDWSVLPYLNGGLFEEDAVDKLHIKLPGSLFEDLFTFLASYNFTVDENDPDDAEVGVDPEMLGKIFESLLEDNKAKGAFYTPKEIVRYMCKESLIAYLDSKLENSSDVQNASKRQNARSANNPTQGTQCGNGENITATTNASKRQNARSANNPTQGTQCGNGENITATTNASERLNAQSANNPTQGTQCGDNDSNEKCVSETRDLTSNGENSGGLPDALEKLNARSANNPTQGTQYGGSDCVSETRDLKTAIRAFVEHHEMQPELESYRDTLDTALRNVKICDPAIGSGAFPMGLLNELWRCREALMDAADTSPRCDLSNTVQAKRSAVISTEKPLRAGGTRPQTRVELKKQIIENNIYGVDIERGAIDIARLRFWLSIVVDAEEPEPLPNFDYKFMQGNSLIESYKGIDLSRISNRLRGGQSKSTQLLLGLDSDFSKKNLQRLMRDYFSVTDHKQKASMRQAINDEVKRLITDFIGGTAADLDKLDPSANQDFFLWHTWFKDIFDNGGFDIVIGNPPYVSSKEIKEEDKSKYREIYQCAKKQYDLYTLFIERGFSLASKNGILSMIVPDSIVGRSNFSHSRLLLLDKTIIRCWVHLDKVFDTADVSSLIFVSSKQVNQKYSFQYIKAASTQDWIDGNVQKCMVDTASVLQDNDLKIRINSDTEEKILIKLGSYSTFDNHFILWRGEEIGRKSNCIENTENASSLPILTGSNVHRYETPSATQFIQEKNVFKSICLYKQEKILVRQLGDFINATYDAKGCVTTQSVYNVVSKESKSSTYYKCIVGLLNSRLFDFIYHSISGDKQSFKRILLENIKRLPYPVISEETEKSIAEKVDLIFEKNIIEHNYDTSLIEHEIDILVYQLYNLTPEEIEIIEQ